jgi:hypothetical protein
MPQIKLTISKEEVQAAVVEYLAKINIQVDADALTPIYENDMINGATDFDGFTVELKTPPQPKRK